MSGLGRRQLKLHQQVLRAALQRLKPVGGGVRRRRGRPPPTSRVLLLRSKSPS
jgi:hypothetical protein